LIGNNPTKRHLRNCEEDVLKMALRKIKCEDGKEMVRTQDPKCNGSIRYALFYKTP
jgi:hypothetical protein